MAIASTGVIVSTLGEQRYACRRCGGCCRWWRIDVTAAERERLLAHDWAAESPRLAGVRLFEERSVRGRPAPAIEAARTDGQCVFLEEDNLCLIHKVLGPDAKPSGCRRFPARIGWLRGAILIGADYACPSLIENVGEPFARVAEEIRDGLGSGAAVAEGAYAHDGGWRQAVPLAPGISMVWDAYLEMETSILEIVALAGRPIAARLGAAGELIRRMVAAWAGRSGVDAEGARAWLGAARSRSYDGAFRACSASASIIWSVPRLAPLIAQVETSHSPDSRRVCSAAGYVLAIAESAGPLFLGTLNGTVDLRVASLVSCDLDTEDFDGYLARFVSNYVLRKSLLESPTLEAGWDYLCGCFSLVQWYARASAALREETVAGRDDLVAGIQVVEKGYVP